MKKTISILVIVAALGFLGWQIYHKAQKAGGPDQRQNRKAVVAVETAPVTRATIRQVGLFTGTLAPRSKILLAPKIAGRVERVLVQIGDTVAPGQLVAVLDDEEFRQQISQARAELEVARANLQERESTLVNAEREYERTVALREKKIASASQLDAAESEYKNQQAKMKVALAQVTQKEAALKLAEVRLAYTEIKVRSTNGAGYRVVGERFVDEGAMLAANNPIVSVLDIGELIAVINVIERDYSKIQTGLSAKVTTDAFPGQVFEGEVRRIAPILKENSREARVEIEVPNDQRRLKPGMFVRVQIEFAEHLDATVVPVNALVKRDGVQGLFMADLGAKTAHFVPVTTGIVSEARAEILEPALDGQVVTLGHHLLEDGAAIMLPPDKASGAAAAGEKEP